MNKPIQGSRLLPIRCYYCNRFLSRFQPLLTSPGFDLEGPKFSYCCKALVGTTRQALLG